MLDHKLELLPIGAHVRAHRAPLHVRLANGRERGVRVRPARDQERAVLDRDVAEREAEVHLRVRKLLVVRIDAGHPHARQPQHGQIEVVGPDLDRARLLADPGAQLGHDAGNRAEREAHAAGLLRGVAGERCRRRGAADPGLDGGNE